MAVPDMSFDHDSYGEMGITDGRGIGHALYPEPPAHTAFKVHNDTLR